MTISTDHKRRALGRGLEALLPSRNSTPVVPVIKAEAEPLSPDGRAFEIAVELIDRSPLQTRTKFDEVQLAELAQSIAATGVVQPIVVRTTKNGRYQLIAGERRWLASKMAGKAKIPAVVREASDEQSLEMTIVENLQRADLNPMEQARAFERLATEFKMTQEQIAKRTGKDRTSIANFLRLLKLPQSVQRFVEAGELSFGHAKALLPLQAMHVEAAAKTVMSKDLSVRETEAFVNEIMGLAPPPPEKTAKVIEPLDPNVREARDLLQRALGLRVKILDRKGKGRVVIEYSSVDDFERIVELAERRS